MTLDEMQVRLRAYNLKRVAEITGIPHVTIWRLVAGKTKRPAWQLVDRLQNFLETGK